MPTVRKSGRRLKPEREPISANSSTVDQSAFYYAVKLENGDVLRLAQEASNIWSVYFRSVPLILLLAAGMAGSACIWRIC